VCRDEDDRDSDPLRHQSLLEVERAHAVQMDIQDQAGGPVRRDESRNSWADANVSTEYPALP
jgi:hypothetical protein